MVDLVNAWAYYSQATPNADVAGFCLHYLTEHSQLTSDDQPETPDDSKPVVTSLSGNPNVGMVDMRPEARLGALVGRLSNYAYFYSKKALQPFNFRSIEEPVYLIMLMQMGTPKKSELIFEMMSEFASGIDIVNRLVGMGYIDEFPDENDRRSKRLRITAAGLAVMQACYPVMNQVADVAYGSLTEGEKALMVQILDKLDRYHADHYRQSKNAGFDEVYERMVG